MTTSFPMLDASGDPGRRHDEAASSHSHVMPDLHQVVDLGASPDHGVLEGAAVDAAVGSDLDVILENAGALGGAFARCPVVGQESEPRAANHGSGLEPDPVSQIERRITDRVRTEHAIVADTHSGTHEHSRPRAGYPHQSERRPRRRQTVRSRPRHQSAHSRRAEPTGGCPGSAGGWTEQGSAATTRERPGHRPPRCRVGSPGSASARDSATRTAPARERRKSGR